MRRRTNAGGVTPDKTTERLIQDRVVVVQEPGSRFSKRKTQKLPFSFWSAVRYTFFLSLLLWWMPTFGQMIAGYVGGRRAGSPWKGALAACLPVVIIYGFLSMGESGILATQISFFLALPSAMAQSVSVAAPFLSPYVEFTCLYIATFVDTLRSTLLIGLNGYLVTVVFAYIGGVISQQKRREMEFTSRTAYPFASPLGYSGRRGPIPSSPTYPNSWTSGHPETLATMKKIPVVARGEAHTRKPTNTPRKGVKPKPVPKDISKAGRTQETNEDLEARYPKKRLNRRLVDRALSNYKRE